MKKLIMLAVAVVCVCGVARAQSETDQKGFTLDAWLQSSTAGRKFYALDVTLAPGWAFNRTLYARVNIDGSYGLWNRGGSRTWNENLSIGPAFGANLCRLGRSDATIGLVGTVARSVLNKTNNWSYAYYDLGAEMYDDRVLVGLGVRHYDSFRKSIDGNRTTFYVKIGWKLFR